MNYFNPKDVVVHEATLNYIAKSGAGFALTPDNEQAFVTAREVDSLRLELGDALRIWAVDNHASPETEHYPSRWRAVRVELVRRMVDRTEIPDEPNTPSAAPSADYAVSLATFLDEARPWTVNELASAMAKANPKFGPAPDLVQKVGCWLPQMHRNGEVASVKVYAKGEQDRASAVYYAKNVDVFYEHLDTPLEDE
jgi:hypothetical protein